MKKRLLPLILALAMALSMTPLAGAEYMETPHLEIGKNGIFPYDDENAPPLSEDHYGEGWSWNASTYTLTLDGVMDPSLSLDIHEAQKPVTIVVNGSNTMYSLSEGDLTGFSTATSTMTGFGILNLVGHSNKIDVINGPYVYSYNTSSFGFYFSVLTAGTVTMNGPLTNPFLVERGLLMIDARACLAQGGCASAIEIPAHQDPSYLLRHCSMTDENGNPVTLETRGSTVVAVKSNGECAGYVRVAPSYYSSFQDVSPTDYFAEPVAWAVDKGITNGTSATTFSPDNTCTQGQIVTFIARAADAGTVSGSNPYSNSAITSDQYFYTPLLWAHKNGIVTDTAIDPNAGCTRSDAVLYLWRLAGSPKASGSTFTDVPSDAPYAQAVAWAVKEGITTGTSATTFSPDQTCTRGQAVTFLHRGLA